MPLWCGSGRFVWGSAGGRCRQRRLVVEELAQVLDQVHERPLGPGGTKAAAAEPPPALVLLVVAEEGLDDAGAQGVEGRSLPGAQPVLHGLPDAGIPGRLSGGGSGVPGCPALLVVLQ